MSNSLLSARHFINPCPSMQRVDFLFLSRWEHSLLDVMVRRVRPNLLTELGTLSVWLPKISKLNCILPIKPLLFFVVLVLHNYFRIFGMWRLTWRSLDTSRNERYMLLKWPNVSSHNSLKFVLLAHAMVCAVLAFLYWTLTTVTNNG